MYGFTGPPSGRVPHLIDRAQENLKGRSRFLDSEPAQLAEWHRASWPCEGLISQDSGLSSAKRVEDAPITTLPFSQEIVRSAALAGRQVQRSLDAASLAVALIASLVATFGAVGADSRWAAALGRSLVDTGVGLGSVPYAAAPSAGWANVPALGELVIAGLVGVADDRGLQLLQIAAVVSGIGLLVVDARRRGATDGGIAAALVLAAVGAAPALAIARLQAFSLALFPLLLVLVRSEARAPSRRVWLLVPLVTLWSNLHGAVLLGVAVAAAYLLLERSRQSAGTALGVLAACLLALSITPALERTPSYYLGVFENEAARRGFGLWARISLASPFDLALLATAAVLLALALRARPAVWELAVVGGLCLATVSAARSGVWLLLFLVAPAAEGLVIRWHPRARVAAAGIAVLLVGTIAGFIRGPITTGAGDRVLALALNRAGGSPVLAEDVLAEQVALAGGRVWVANPIDAFTPGDQRAYLDWSLGGAVSGKALRAGVRVLLVHPESPAEDRLAGAAEFRELGRDANAVVYEQVRG